MSWPPRPSFIREGSHPIGSRVLDSYVLGYSRQQRPAIKGRRVVEQNIWTANIQTWLDNRKNASLGLLAKRADIPYPTLRRVFHGERRPSYATAMKIAFETMPTGAAIDVLEKEYGQSLSVIRAISKGQTIPISAEDGKCIESLDELITSGMCLAKNGSARAEIFNRLGNNGVEKLNKLLNKGLLVEWNGRILPKADKRLLTDCRDTVTRAKLSLDLHSDVSIGSPGFLGYFGMGGLNEEGRASIETILNEARHAIAAVFNDEGSSGDFVLAVTISSTSISKH
jgi:hypothetical protein